jgi:hypothetical protein
MELDETTGPSNYTSLSGIGLDLVEHPADGLVEDVAAGTFYQLTFGLTRRDVGSAVVSETVFVNPDGAVERISGGQPPQLTGADN